MGVAPAGDKAHLKIRPAAAADGRDVLAKLVADINRRPFLADCHTRHPAAGHLLVRYVLPSCEARAPRTAAHQIHLEYSGSLADTPLARCLNEHLAAAVAAAALPAEVLGAYRDERYDWPRNTAGAMRFELAPPPSR